MGLPQGKEIIDFNLSTLIGADCKPDSAQLMMKKLSLSQACSVSSGFSTTWLCLSYTDLPEISS